MKCPNCGRELSEADRFCPSCGERILSPGEDRPDLMNAYAVQERKKNAEPEKPSRLKLAVKAAGAVLLYLLLYLVIQSCVVSNYMLSAADMSELSAAAESGDAVTMQEAYARFLREGAALVTKNEAILLLIANLLSIAVLCLLLRLRKKTPYDEFDFHAVNPLRLIQFALLGVAMNIVLSVLLSVIPIPEEMAQMQEAQYAGLMEGNLFWVLLSVGIVGPAAEEIFYRGMVITRLGSALGSAAAGVVSAVIFGLAHVTPVAVGYAFVFGMVLALVYNRYGSVLPGIVCHCFFNLTSFWLDGMENETALTVLTAVSAVLIVLIWRSAMTRFPTFADVLHDAAGKIRPEDPEKRAIAAECRRIRASADTDGQIEQLEKLAERWDAIDRGVPPSDDPPDMDRTFGDGSSGSDEADGNGEDPSDDEKK